MRALRQIVFLAAALAVFAGAAGFAQVVPVDDCCSAPVTESDDCCPSVCDHCPWCTPVVAVVISSAPMFSLSEPPDRLEPARFRDPLAPEPRGILHVPKTA